jgi:branched-chain amino acid transport system permease protein
MEIFLQALVNGLLMGGFYSLMGMGQNIIFGVMKIVNFCHGEMLMVGMYLTYVLYVYAGIDPYAAVPIVALIMFGLGALIQVTLITPSLGTKSFTNLLFMTVGIGLLLSNGALVLFGSDYLSIKTSYSEKVIQLGGMVNVSLPRLISFIVLICISIALFVLLKYTTAGKQIRAVSQNSIGAEVVGIDVKRIYVLTYGLGTALAGVAGALLTQFYTIFPTAGASFGFRALIVVVVGGLGSIPGAFFAGIFLGLLETMVALFISPSYSDLIVFITFIVILVIRQTVIARRK